MAPEAPITRACAAAFIGLTACSSQPRAVDSAACPEVPSQPSSPQPAIVPAPWALTQLLEGPVADLDDVVRGRIESFPEDCHDERDPPPEIRTVTMVTRVEADGPLLEAVSLRYPGDIACAPIEYCALALRTAQGWWITSHDENAWCDGVTGPSSRIELEDEDLTLSTDEPGLLIHQGVRLLHHREYTAGIDGNREESWSTTERWFEQRCQVTSDGRAHCQR